MFFITLNSENMKRFPNEDDNMHFTEMSCSVACYFLKRLYCAESNRQFSFLILFSNLTSNPQTQKKDWCKCKKKFKFKFKTTDTRRNWSVTHVAMKNKIGSIFEASLVSIAVWFITLITSKTSFVHLLGDSTTWRSDRFWRIEWKTLICQM